VNFFNTTDAYSGGQSEQMLGAALGARRKDVVIATKAGFRTGDALIHTGLSRQHLYASVEASMRRLNTDYLDVYLLHRVDPYTPVEEVLETLNDLVRQGKVRYIGFSNWPAWLAAKAVGLQKQYGWAEFRVAEMHYSLVSRDLEYEVAPMALDAGIGVIVWSPLAGGFLTRKYTRQNPQGDGGRLTGFDIIPFDRERGYDLLDKLKAIADAHATTPAQVSLAWLLTHPAVTSVLIGASKLTQLEDNLQAEELTLSRQELDLLDESTRPTATYPNWFNETIFDQQVKAAIGK